MLAIVDELPAGLPVWGIFAIILFKISVDSWTKLFGTKGVSAAEQSAANAATVLGASEHAELTSGLDKIDNTLRRVASIQQETSQWAGNNEAHRKQVEILEHISSALLQSTGTLQSIEQGMRDAHQRMENQMAACSRQSA